MKLTHTPRAEKVYSRLLNGMFEFRPDESNTLVDTDTFTDRPNVLYKYITMKVGKKLLIQNSNILNTYPFIIVKNTLIVLNFVPDFEYWLNILGMCNRGLYPNINKVHVILGINKGQKLHKYVIDDLIRAIEIMNKEGHATPRISFTTGFHNEDAVVPDSYRKRITINNCGYSMEIKYDTSNDTYKNIITIIPVIGDKHLHLFADNPYGFAVKYEKSIKRENK